MCPGNTIPLSLVEKMATLNSKEDDDVQKARDVRAGQGCSENCRSFRVKNLRCTQGSLCENRQSQVNKKKEVHFMCHTFKFCF